jgi:hypothetical protein
MEDITVLRWAHVPETILYSIFLIYLIDQNLQNNYSLKNVFGKKSKFLYILA